MAEILHQLRLVVYPIIYKVLSISGGAGFLPSTVPYRWGIFGEKFPGKNRMDTENLSDFLELNCCDKSRGFPGDGGSSASKWILTKTHIKYL